jgi:hypothetical protein
MNIIWQKPDETLAVTSVFPDAKTAMDLAVTYASLVPQKSILVADNNAKSTNTTSQISAIQAHLATISNLNGGRTPQPIDASLVAAWQIADDAISANVLVEQNAIDAAKSAIQQNGVAIEANNAILEKIAFYEDVSANIGLSIQGHADLLQARGDVPANWVVKATEYADNQFPQGAPQEAWRFVNGAIVIDAAAAQALIPPNIDVFVDQVKAAFGGMAAIIQNDQLVGLANLFFSAVNAEAWADVQAIVIGAHTANKITDTQYAAIKSAAVSNKIPLTLP